MLIPLLAVLDGVVEVAAVKVDAVLMVRDLCKSCLSMYWR